MNGPNGLSYPLQMSPPDKGICHRVEQLSEGWNKVISPRASVGLHNSHISEFIVVVTISMFPLHDRRLAQMPIQWRGEE
jgi:hypothetical protein